MDELWRVRCAGSTTPEGAELMDLYFDPVVLKLISILKKALPKLF